MTNTNTNQTTDKAVFNQIFKELRKDGFIALQNHTCCQGCGWSEIESRKGVTDDSNVVFYHQQDAESFVNKELKYPIYLAWNGNGEKIKSAFEKHGYEVEWNGSKHERIAIKPKAE